MTTIRMARRVAVARIGADRREAIRRALELVGLPSTLGPGAIVALKPNLTYPYYKRGVTTSPSAVDALVSVLIDRGLRPMIVESDGGYGAWSAEEAFEGHGLRGIAARYRIPLHNLSKLEATAIPVRWRGTTRTVQLPRLLLEEVQLVISMPVPKVHAMTGLTLAMKNQWGCIPDRMRLRNHFFFDEAVLAVNERLRPFVVADGEYFLDRNGPMDGDPVRMDVVIAGTDVFSFDRALSSWMGWDWSAVPHLRRAVKKGLAPRSMAEIECLGDLEAVTHHRFTLHRSPRSWIALAGFRSRLLTWFGYESWFGRVVLHWLLYAIVGPNIKPAPEQENPLQTRRDGQEK